MISGDRHATAILRRAVLPAVRSLQRGRLVGSTLIAYALVGYPAIAAFAGQRYPAVPTFGLPCPTTLVTLGFLVWCLRPVPWSVLVVPVAWSVIAMAVAVPFGIAEDFALPVAAALALGTLLRPSRRVPRVASSGRRPFQLGF